MITKFKKYNEGINHLLVGPTKEEIEVSLKKDLKKNKIDFLSYIKKCKQYNIDNGFTKKEIWEKIGYDVIFETPEEFFIYINSKMKEKKFKNQINKYYKGVIYFEYTLTYDNLYVNYNRVWNILSIIFNMNEYEIKDFINKMVQKYFGWIDFNFQNIHQYHIS